MDKPPPADSAEIQMPRPALTLSGGQLKSLAAGRRLARGIGLIETAWGIHSVRVILAGCFICCDTDWRRLDRTPEEMLVRDIIMLLEHEKARINPPPWEPPYWYVAPIAP